MAENTDISLRNQVMYSIYVRNHTKEGTFRAAEVDLDRIKDLGVDIIWLMPIHPIGVEKKKGTLGCPYAIQDYRGINTAYGTKDDFIHFVEEVHKKGMKCIIDVVYNHTSPDSWLAKHHPEYFYKKADGSFGNKTGDWDDVIDLDYNNKGLWDYQMETLCQWAEIVDGFRCDVASLIPLDFWIGAREKVSKIKSACIWLAESVDPGFIRDNRRRNLTAHSDGEVYQAFDMVYDYDVLGYKNQYLQGEITLESYITILNFQNNIYPDNYVKLRFLENHDQPRAKYKINNESDLKNWTAFLYFQKGTALLYGGQETENEHIPSLFDIDPVNWNTGKNISNLLKSLYFIKQKDIIAVGDYYLEADSESDTIVGTYEKDSRRLIGIFSLKSKPSNVKIQVTDGNYVNLINGKIVKVNSERLMTDGLPIMIEI